MAQRVKRRNTTDYVQKTSLTSLPVEILERTFRFACIDGGFTGCSLSLTSKFIRNASRSARFHSVQIGFRHLSSPNPDQLGRFLASFASERACAYGGRATTPRVRHLLLASGVEPERRADGYGGDADLLGRYHQEVRALMRLVAADLHTLTLLNERRGGGAGAGAEALSMPASLGKTRFPNLRELTVIDHFDQLRFAPVPEPFPPWYPAALFGGALSGEDDGSGDGDGAGPEPCGTAGAYPTLPRLARLHISGAQSLLGLGTWAARAPRLTHLRISDAEPYASCEALEALERCVLEGGATPDAGRGAGQGGGGRPLRPASVASPGAGSDSGSGFAGRHAGGRAPTDRADGAATGPAGSDGGGRRAFARLEVMLVQPCPLPLPGGMCGTPRKQYRHFLRRLLRLPPEDEWKLPFALGLLYPREPLQPVRKEGETVIRDWRDRLAGGPGSWSAAQIVPDTVRLNAATRQGAGRACIRLQ